MSSEGFFLCVGWMYPAQPRCPSLVLFTSGLSWNKRADANPTGSGSISTDYHPTHGHTCPHTHTLTHTCYSSRATKPCVFIVTEMEGGTERKIEREKRGERRMKKWKISGDGSWCFPPTSCCLISLHVFSLYLGLSQPHFHPPLPPHIQTFIHH